MGSSLYNASSLYGATTKAANSAVGAIVWLILSLVLALVGGILVYVLFLNKKNDGKFKNGFVNWLYEVLGFRKMLVEMLLKVSYLVLAIFITLYSLSLIISNFVGFLFMLIGGNLLLRIGYEFALMTIIMCRNTTEINANIKKIVPKEESVKQDVE